jgi:hypothetical protein
MITAGYLVLWSSLSNNNFAFTALFMTTTEFDEWGSGNL